MSDPAQPPVILSGPADLALRRIYALPTADQLAVFTQLRAFLGERAIPAPENEAIIDQRWNALAAIDIVVTELGLTSPRELKVKQYDEVARRKSLPASHLVIQAFGLWREALLVASGESMRPTSRQTRIQRSARWEAKYHTETILFGLREFLAQGFAATSYKDYNRFVDEWNADPPDGALPLPKAGTVYRRLGVRTWEDGLAVARGEKPLRDATAAHDQSHIGSRDASRISGLAQHQLRKQIRGFPAAVVKLQTAWLWRRSDVIDWVEGRPVSARVLGEENNEFYETRQLAERMGVSYNAVRLRVDRKRWDMVPEPYICLTNATVWRRDTVEQWLAAHRGVMTLKRGQLIAPDA